MTGKIIALGSRIVDATEERTTKKRTAAIRRPNPVQRDLAVPNYARGCFAAIVYGTWDSRRNSITTGSTL
jgi:hypothetical protein